MLSSHRPKPPGTTEALLEELVKVAKQSRDLLRHLVAQDQATTAILSTDQYAGLRSWTTLFERYVSMATQATATFTNAADGTSQPPPTGDGSGIDVVFSSDNPNVTIGEATASGDTATATITGTEAFNLSAVVSNQSGTELLDNDGVTPFVQPATIAVPASTPPEQATTAVLSVE